MATNRSAQAALTIALSVFVMLTFALGVTTYLFFTKRQEAEEAQGTAERQTVDLQAELAATKEEMEALRGIIGVDADAPVEEIEAGLNDLLAGDFSGYTGDQKSYRELIDWLRTEFRDKSTLVKTAEAQKKEFEAQKEAAIKDADDAVKAAKQSADEAKSELEAAAAAFRASREKHEEQQQDLTGRQSAAESRARELESLKGQIVSVGDYLPPARQVGFAEKDSGSQLELIRNELRNQTKFIARLNDLLSRARIADPALQAVIAEYRSGEDRIDGIDGSVVDIDPRQGTALVSFSSTKGIRPGLLLHVFSPDAKRPQFGDRKAALEVAEVEGPNIVRAIIRREDTRNPILSGDGVASSLWAPGAAPGIVIVGFADVDEDGRSDMEELATLVTNAGGRVVDSVTPDTAIVVDLGTPPQGSEAEEDPDWSDEKKRRTRTLKTAEKYGTRIGGVDVLLDMLGLDADSFTADRLPRRRSSDLFLR